MSNGEGGSRATLWLEKKVEASEADESDLIQACCAEYFCDWDDYACDLKHMGLEEFEVKMLNAQAEQRPC